MKVFVTGATGYIGGSIATALLARGDQVIGLARDDAGMRSLARRGIAPIKGTLGDADALRVGAASADAVVDAAEANSEAPVAVFLEALAATAKTYVRTSGSGIVGDLSGGEPTEAVFDETTAFTPAPAMALRAALDQRVLAAASQGLRTAVVRPSLIHGPGRGVDRESYQVPLLLDHALRTREPRWIGRGLNQWSNVHIDDLVALYLAILDAAPAGALYHAEAGELAMRDLVLAIAATHGLEDAAGGWSAAQAEAGWGPRSLIAIGSNSRVRAVAARRDLGWRPAGPALLDEVRDGYYAKDYLDRHHPGCRPKGGVAA